MNDKLTVEITADTVDEAVAKGCTELGVTPADVIVEIIDEPSRGVFGIGARPAKVRLMVLRRPAPPPPAPAEPVQQPPAKQERPSPSAGRTEHSSGKKSRNRDSQRPRQKPPQVEEYEYNEEEEAYAFSDTQGDAAGEDGEAAKAVLAELLRHMNVRAEIKVTRAAASNGENPPWLLNVEGRDVNSLIGRRGETLASLQYITRLIASRRMGRRANIVVDVDGYKARRSQKLRDLALRMADQAVREARTVVLEPMPPHERRMIHMALRNRPDVFTQSTGEGESRKVTIVPK